jgi:hypothetical protein
MGGGREDFLFPEKSILVLGAVTTQSKNVNSAIVCVCVFKRLFLFPVSDANTQHILNFNSHTFSTNFSSFPHAPCCKITLVKCRINYVIWRYIIVPRNDASVKTSRSD